MGTSIDLPDEVIEVILSKSNIKSVVRFKSVSKSWQSIISEPPFSRIHLIHRSKMSENQNMFLLWAPQKRLGALMHLIRLEEEDGIFRTESLVPYPSPIFGLPLCSCNGLILFGEKGSNHQYMLWNPSIRKHIIIGGPDTNSHLWHRHHIYHDSITADYKIVFVSVEHYAVYSCTNGSWSELKDLPRDLNLMYDVCRVSAQGMLFRELVCFVDGCFYSVCDGQIVCFNASDGKLHKFPQPNEAGGGVVLVEVFGRLCFHGFLKEDRKRLEMWVMEKHGSFEKWVMVKDGILKLKEWCYSWRKLISIENEEEELWLRRPSYTSINSVYLKARTNKVAYDPLENRFRQLENIESPIIESRIFPYSENLYVPCSNILV